MADQRLNYDSLGELAGLNGSTVNRVLRGLQRPSADTVQRLALALGLLSPFGTNESVGEAEAVYRTRLAAAVEAACEVLTPYPQLVAVLRRILALSPQQRSGVFAFLGLAQPPTGNPPDERPAQAATSPTSPP